MDDEPLTIEKECPFCHLDGIHYATLLSEGPHYASIKCTGCGRGIGFLPKPQDDPTKYKRPAAHLDLVRKYGRGFCELCLLSVDKLPARQTLVGHHVIEYKDGGDPKRENVWILCTRCEKLVHWARTYFGPQTIGEVLKKWPE